jgi:hypothetical protein
MPFQKLIPQYSLCFRDTQISDQAYAFYFECGVFYSVKKRTLYISVENNEGISFVCRDLLRFEVHRTRRRCIQRPRTCLSQWTIKGVGKEGRVNRLSSRGQILDRQSTEAIIFS